MAGLRKQPRPLSAEAKQARRPPPVEVLLRGALHDTVHRDIGRARRARRVRAT